MARTRAESRDPLPLYGFLQGDSMGLLIVAYPHETVATLGSRLQSAASVRVRPREPFEVRYRERILRPEATLAEAGLEPLERFDVVPRR